MLYFELYIGRLIYYACFGTREERIVWLWFPTMLVDEGLAKLLQDFNYFLRHGNRLANGSVLVLNPIELFAIATVLVLLPASAWARGVS